MDNNLHDIHLEGDVGGQAVAVGEVGAPTRFRYIKSKKYMLRLYLVLAALAAIFVFSSLIRLSLKSSNTSTASMDNAEPHGTDIDLSGASIREGHLLVLLHDMTVDEAERVNLNNATSPQREALRWLGNEDPMMLEIPETQYDPSYPAFLQRYSSAVLAFAFGAELLTPIGFLSASHECEWKAKFRRHDGSIFNQGLICEPGQDKIIQVVLQTIGLSGTIPRELGNLHSITHLHLDENKILGHLPETMRHLSALREFTVTRNHLSGHLPSFLASLASLRHAELSKNHFSGPLSSAFGSLGTEDGTADDSVSPLRFLAVDHNKLNGPIASLKAFVALEELYLNDNAFSGHIGETLTELSQLAIIDASKNKLSGKIPDYLLQLPSMVIFDVHTNQLSGQIPHGNATTLKYLDFHDNALSSVIPQSLGEHPNLAYLDLSMNQLEGLLISEMGQLKMLQYLFLADNPKLDPAPIPEWILQLPVLSSVSLKNTQRIGGLPDWLGKLEKLRLLDLEKNSLNGTIPHNLKGANSLEFLFLNHNKLHGVVPETIGNLTDLVLLNLDHNNLTGAVPIAICELPNLDVLVTDCEAALDQLEAEIECTCCTMCCVASDKTCNNRDWSGRYRDDWGEYYERYNIVEDGDIFEIVNAGDN